MDSSVGTSVTMRSLLKAVQLWGTPTGRDSSRNRLSLSIEFRSSTGFGQDHIGGFLRDQIHRGRDKETRDARKHRRVDDAKPVRMMDAKIAAQHSALLDRADRTRS